MIDPAIPEILKPRLWRPILIFPKGPAPVMIGPGQLSSFEALDWINRTARSKHARGRATRAVALTAPVPIVDAPRLDKDRMRSRNRKAAIKKAISGTVAGSGPSVIYRSVLDALPIESGILQTIVLGLPGVTRRRAEDSAAVTLIGLGLPTQEILNKRRWPKRWLVPKMRSNSDGLAAAAVLDWRTTQGSWPKTSDDVGATFRERLWRAHVTRAEEDEARRRSGAAGT